MFDIFLDDFMYAFLAIHYSLPEYCKANISTIPKRKRTHTLVVRNSIVEHNTGKD